jgi:hypothetical protein
VGIASSALCSSNRLLPLAHARPLHSHWKSTTSCQWRRGAALGFARRRRACRTWPRLPVLPTTFITMASLAGVSCTTGSGRRRSSGHRCMRRPLCMGAFPQREKRAPRAGAHHAGQGCARQRAVSAVLSVLRATSVTFHTTRVGPLLRTQGPAETSVPMEGGQISTERRNNTFTQGGRSRGVCLGTAPSLGGASSSRNTQRWQWREWVTCHAWGDHVRAGGLFARELVVER